MRNQEQEASRTDQHQPLPCTISNCLAEATRWFDALVIPAVKLPNDTFYLCEQHASALSPEDDFIRLLEVMNGKVHIKEVELAVYACSERCSVCND